MFQPDKLADLISEDRCAGPKPYTLEHLAEWLEKFPAEQTYDYWDRCGCVFAQYMQHIPGAVKPGHESPYRSSVAHFTFEQRRDVSAIPPYTFGAALERTRAAINAART